MAKTEAEVEAERKAAEEAGEVAKARAVDLQKELERVTKKLQAKLDEEEKAKNLALAEQGKFKELYESAEAKRKEELEPIQKELAEAKTRMAKIEEDRAKLREATINKLTDDTLKGLASKLSDLEDVQKFVELHTTQRMKTFENKGGAAAAEDFKTQVANAKTMKELKEIAARNNVSLG